MNTPTQRRPASVHAQTTAQAAATRDQIDQLALLVLSARDHRAPLDVAFRDAARHQLGLDRESFARLLRRALDDIQQQIAEERRIQQELDDRLGGGRLMAFRDFLLSCCGGGACQ
ncbi:hypothetical protein pneo_cds_819 [Pandoravirus neocaledonia]|uniref:Uncharacterized protein n=1 Tax=Pandoravirus neocaledonia TaxID=2107708 RepID=A0A2U7UDB9_9VIRU|nr:hypothetical protein pneo_cds_819 [Pandoravirus neocaledonia]AVK76426.1 hypothetical protein pneo_cds_819 [Pandoravirus neocaledonia]